MNQRALGGFIVLAAFVLAFGSWALLPALESSETAAARTAGERVERARRLLHRHSPTLSHVELRRAELASLGADLERAGVGDLDGEVDADLFRERYDAITARHESSLRAPGGDPTGQIREGVSGLDSLAEENAAVLGRALAEVNRALGASPQDAEAHRLKAVILYHDGTSQSARAMATRARAEPLRQEIGRLAREALDLTQQTQSGIAAAISAQITALGERERELEAETGVVSARAAELERTIADLESKKAHADASATAARNKLDDLRDRGVDLADPQGGAAYSDEYLALAREYDESFRAAHIAERGDYPQAEIDRSGDYIHGRYVEGGSDANLTVRHGLIHYRDERAVVSARLDGLHTAMTNLRTDKARLEGEKAAHDRRVARAGQRLADIAGRAATLWADLTAVGDEAEQIEAGAAGVLRASASSASQAASHSAAWVRDARDRQNAVSDSSKDRSAFHVRLDDRWIEGYAKAIEADAHLAIAWIQYARFDGLRREADLLDFAGTPLKIAAGAEERRASAATTRDEGIGAVEAAMAALKAAHGGSGQHWTIVAQGAGVEYLLALFGDESRVGDVIETYRTALQGRENEDYVAPLADRLRVLENR